MRYWRPETGWRGRDVRSSDYGDTKACQEQNPGLLTAICIPCGFAQAGFAFADCKSDLEKQGYERQKDTK